MLTKFKEIMYFGSSYGRKKLHILKNVEKHSYSGQKNPKK